MFFILSKILFYLVMPLAWILAALLVALFTKKEKARKRALAVATGLVLFFTNPFLTNEAWLLWEYPPTPVRQVGRYDAAIILTGITNQGKSPHDRIYTNKGADRVLHPVQLYRNGRIGKFIITGGSGSLSGAYSSEARELKQILVDACIPPADIILEDKSRNTHENALFTAGILKRQPQFKKLLLVTSAFHMRRARECFEKEGIRTDVFSTDFYTHDRSFAFANLFVPREVCLAEWQKLFHEVLGYMVYEIVGYS